MRAGKINPIGKVSQPGWEKIFETEIGASTPASQLLLTFQGMDGETPSAGDTGQTITWAGTSKLIGPKDVSPAGTAVLDDMKHAVTFNGTAAIDDIAHQPTLIGTAQIDSAQKKFGRGSLLLDGNSDYVTIPDSEDWSFGVEDFTIDFWVRFNAIDKSQIFVEQYEDGSNRWFFQVDANNKLFAYWQIGDIVKGRYASVSALPGIATDTWFHIAFVRNGTTALAFCNGASVPLTEVVPFSGNDVGKLSAVLTIGRYIASPTYYLDGWLDEFRISKGIARWTSNFTVPDKAYVPDYYTKLLLHFDENDGDTDTKDAAIHVPIGSTACYFDGNSDYLTMPDSVDWYIETGDASIFTIDFWIKFNDSTVQQRIFAQGTANNQTYLRWTGVNWNYTSDTSSGNAYSYSSTNAVVVDDVWYHVAFVKNGLNFYIFQDGVLLDVSDGSSGSPTWDHDRTGNVYIGKNAVADNYYLNGWLDEFRVSKGIARWTSDFAEPYPYAWYKCNDNTNDTVVYDSGSGSNNGVVKDDAELIVNFNGADAATTYTAESGQTVTFGGTAQLDTAQKKYGLSSLLLDGNSDYVTVPDSNDWNFGTGDFTIDMFVRFASLDGTQIIYSQYVDDNNRIELDHYAGDKMSFNVTNSSTVKAAYNTPSAIGLTINTWYHVAVVRSGTSLKLYIDGTEITLTETTAISTNSLDDVGSALGIGARPGGVGGGRYFNGWMDSVRVTKGTALWTSAFTPPAGEPESSAIMSTTGKINEALEFNGLTQTVDTGVQLNSSLPFTFCGWAKVVDKSLQQGFIGCNDSSTNRTYIGLRNGNYWMGIGDSQKYTYSADAISEGEWFHFALVSDGSIATYYVNASSVDATSTFTGQGQQSSDTNHIGGLQASGNVSAYTKGTLDDVRIYQTALSVAELEDIYNEGSGKESVPAFPTNTPYEPDDYTVLLLPFEGYDGDTTTEDMASQPRFSDAALYCDGSAYISLPNSDDWVFGTGDWTIDYWVKFEDLTVNHAILQHHTSADDRFEIYNTPTAMYFLSISGAVEIARYSKAFTWSLGIWYHVSIVRNSGTLSLYINGIDQSWTATTPIDSNTDFTAIANTLKLGIGYGGADLHGWLGEFRISKGIARWTSNFTVPTERYEKDEYTAALLHFDGLNGSTHMIDSAQRGKTGSSALWLDGNSDYITLPDSTDWDLIGNSSETWTVDGWFKTTNYTLEQELFSQWESGTKYWAIRLSSNKVQFLLNTTAGGSKYFSDNTTLSNDTWYHFALVKIGTDYGLYVNGIQGGYMSDSSTETLAAVLNIGRKGDNTQFFNGCLDGMRISKANVFGATPVAGLTDTLTPPTTPEDYVGTKAVTIFGLEGDKDEQYMLDICGIDDTTVAGWRMRLNNDSGTNYGTQYLRGNNTTISAARATANEIAVGGTNADDNVTQCNCLIHAKSGYVRTILNEQSRTITGTTVTDLFVFAYSWNNTADEITSMSIYVTSDNMNIGTLISLYRRIEQ